MGTNASKHPASDKPLFSIITPIFNAAQFLNKCFDSVLAQSFDNFEVVAIDDGSTDASLAIAQSYASKDARFRVYSQSNVGSSETYNRCIAKSKGDYIITLDDDDWFSPELLMTFYTVINKYGSLDYISGSCLFYDEEGRVICRNGTTADVYCTCYEDTIKVFTNDRGSAMTHNRKAIRRDLFDGLRFEGPGRGADTIVFAAINLRSRRSYFVSDVMFHALVRGQTQSRTAITPLEYRLYAERDAKHLPLFSELCAGRYPPIFELVGFPDDYKNALINNPGDPVVRKLGKTFWAYRALYCNKHNKRMSFWIWCHLPRLALRMVNHRQ